MRQGLSLEYMAGFFDGEGSVGLYAQQKACRYSLRACITQVKNKHSEEVLGAFQKQFGGSITNSKQYKSHHSPAMAWSIYGDKAAEFLRMIQPLTIIKNEQIELVCQWQEKYGSSRSHPRDSAFRVSKLNDARTIMDQLRSIRTKGPEISVKLGSETNNETQP